MKYILLSSLILFNALVLAQPTASSSASISSAAVLQRIPSIDPRIEKWGKMKIALPDGLLPDDAFVGHDKRKEEEIVPMIVMKDADLPLSALVNKPLYKHQRNADGQPAYKHMGMAANGESFDPVHIIPLTPEKQQELVRVQEAEKAQISQQSIGPVASGRRYKNFVGLSDQGERQKMSLPVGKLQSSLPDKVEVQQEAHVEGVVQKKIVGMDNYGRMRYLDVPYYNRAASASAALPSSQQK